MKLFPIFLALVTFSLQAYADYETVNGILTNITLAVTKLTGEVEKFDGQPINAVPILDEAQAIALILEDGSAKAKATTVLGLNDTIAILPGLGGLESAVTTAITALEGKKPQFETVGVTFVVADQLIALNGGANQLVKDIVAKLPAYLPTAIAQIFYQGILTTLDKAVKSFGGEVQSASTLPVGAKGPMAPKGSAPQAPALTVPKSTTPKSAKGNAGVPVVKDTNVSMAQMSGHTHGRRFTA